MERCRWGRVGMGARATERTSNTNVTDLRIRHVHAGKSTHALMNVLEPRTPARHGTGHRASPIGLKAHNLEPAPAQAPSSSTQGRSTATIRTTTEAARTRARPMASQRPGFL